MPMRNQDEGYGVGNGGGYGPGDWWTTNLPEVSGFLPGSENVTAPVMAPPPPSNDDPSAYFNTLFPGDYLDSAMLIAKEAELAAHGIKVLRNAEGRAGKIQLPNGQIIDVVQGGGTGLNRKQWLTGDASGGATGVQAPGMAGTLIDPWTKAFVPPSAEDARNTPGYQAGLQDVQRAVQTGAAAKGTLLTGGTLKGLAQKTLDYADQNYGNVYNRGLNEYLLGRENFYNNQDRPYTKLSGLATLGRPVGS